MRGTNLAVIDKPINEADFGTKHNTVAVLSGKFLRSLHVRLNPPDTVVEKRYIVTGQNGCIDFKRFRDSTTYQGTLAQNTPRLAGSHVEIGVVILIHDFLPEKVIRILTVAL